MGTALGDRKISRTAKNAAFVFLIVVGTTFGNLLLALGMRNLANPESSSVVQFIASFFNPLLIGGTCLLLIAMLAQLAMYTWADLSFVLPVTASAYVVTALLGKFFLNEHISVARWAGTLLITAGAAFVSTTEPDTKHHGGSSQ